jgi:hypothetical protein
MKTPRSLVLVLVLFLSAASSRAIGVSAMPQVASKALQDDTTAGAVRIITGPDGDTVRANSCSRTDVQAAVNAAGDGDTVLVPAGNCMWATPAASTPAVLIAGKAITLQGAGIAQTVITDATGTNWNESLIRVDGVEGKPFRITGFTFTGINVQASVQIYGNCKSFRLDHCEFESPTDFVTAINTSGYTYGVIDHCTFFNSRVLVSGDDDAAWQRPLTLGSANAVYVEDCTFDCTAQCNTVDANAGGRYVFRYNTMRNSHVEAHSGCPSGLRATFSHEVYANTIVAETPTYRPFLIRGGTGVIFNNTITGSYTSPDIHVDDQRSCVDVSGYSCHAPWDRCDGDSIYDGNEPAGYGYPCRDQIGRSTDSGITTTQALEPMYEWDNTYGGADVDIILNPAMCVTMTYHIQEGRDFYNDTSRPGYTPYVYPHPLTWELVLIGSPDDETIHLDWTVHAYLPPTSTWRIDYYSETTPSAVSHTNIVSPTRAYTLTGLTNYTWYTVTLTAVGTTSALTDTVHAMPTDRFVYLPLVLRQGQ